VQAVLGGVQTAQAQVLVVVEELVLARVVLLAQLGVYRFEQGLSQSDSFLVALCERL